MREVWVSRCQIASSRRVLSSMQFAQYGHQAIRRLCRFAEMSATLPCTHQCLADQFCGDRGAAGQANRKSVQAGEMLGDEAVEYRRILVIRVSR